MKYDQKEKDIGESTFECKKIRGGDNQLTIIDQFSPEQQSKIVERLNILSVIPKIIGQDFDMPVELNKPNGGWHWDFKLNVVRVDPVDLLEKPIDYLRFVMAHEGGHRRISHVDFIPLHVWKQKGFSFLMNAIEDPRDNNFLADAYPRFREEAHLAYEADLKMSAKMKAEASEKLGHQPRFTQAGLEFIRLWYSWFKKESMTIDDTLPEDVKDVVKKALLSAEDAWSRYPSRAETEGERGQETIKAFAKVSYEIILEEIWPEYKKLVDKDLEDQKMSEYLKELEEEKQENMQKGEAGEGENGESDQSESDKSESQNQSGEAGNNQELTPEEQSELEKALDKAIDELGQGGEESEGKSESTDFLPKEAGKKSISPRAISLDSLSPELREKLRQKISSLSEEKKKELTDKAEKAIEEFEKSISEELAGKMSENPEQKSEREQKAGREEKEKAEHQEAEQQEEGGEKSEKGKTTEKDSEDDKKSEDKEKQKKVREEKNKREIEKVRSELEKITQGDQSIYEENRREVQRIINSLTSELRNIFRKRHESKYEAGRKSGRHIDIATRIKEIAKGINVFDSRAWMRREAPLEKDYAITLLVDLSGSMRGKKVAETFKAVIALAEVMSQLGIKLEVLGFNDRLHEFLVFDKKLTKDVCDKMSLMLKEIESPRARYNDDGWAVQESARRLSKRQEAERIMLVLSDGIPEESADHSGKDFELKSVVDRIVAKKKEKIIGLGIGKGTEHVSHYYPHSIANVSVEEMAGQIAELIVKVIEGNDKI